MCSDTEKTQGRLTPNSCANLRGRGVFCQGSSTRFSTEKGQAWEAQCGAQLRLQLFGVLHVCV
jgi:hypothetical protein